jgi:hypothetical protein
MDYLKAFNMIIGNHMSIEVPTAYGIADVLVKGSLSLEGWKAAGSLCRRTSSPGL